jgi:hypothetical protein
VNYGNKRESEFAFTCCLMPSQWRLGREREMGKRPPAVGGLSVWGTEALGVGEGLSRFGGAACLLEGQGEIGP